MPPNSMSEYLRDRLGQGSTKRDQIKAQIQVVIFGPYAGDCKFILRSVGTLLREKSNINAHICEDVPDSRALRDESYGDEVDEYNLQSSIECVNTADYAVFAFLKARQRRFEEYGPFKEREIDKYHRPHYIPQDLNASNVIEFEKWMDAGMPNPARCSVIFEDDVGIALGSLVRGIVQTGSITVNEIDTTRGDTIQKMYATIRADFESWLTANEQRFLAGIRE